MKLIFLTSRFPFPLEKGDKLRSYYFLRELSKFHEICLISLNEKKVKPEHIREIEKFVSKVYVFPLSRISRYLNAFLAIFQSRPLQAGYFYNASVCRKIHSIIANEKPQHIFAQLLRTALYVKNINISKTIDYQDVFSRGIQRRLSRVHFPFRLVLMLEYMKVKRFEQYIFHWFNNRIIITENDRILMPVTEKDQIHVISNGVDIEFFDLSKVEKTEKRYDIIFTGNMGYPPNVDCAQYIAREVLPLIIKKYPSIRIVFAGASPHPKVLRLACNNIEVTGWVEDIRKYYAASGIFLAPMQIGTGLQNKLLEAMAMSLPCVTSELANSALGAVHGNHILVGNTPEEIAKHIDTLICDSDFASELARNGQKFVSENFSWKTQAEKLHRILTGSENI